MNRLFISAEYLQGSSLQLICKPHTAFFTLWGRIAVVMKITTYRLSWSAVIAIHLSLINHVNVNALLRKLLIGYIGTRLPLSIRNCVN